MKPKPIRSLVLVLGDQLDLASAAFTDFDPEQDVVWMAEVAHESTKVWNSKVRITLFLSAMRHFREELRARSWRVCYRELSPDGGVWRGSENQVQPCRGETFREVLTQSILKLKPLQLVMVEAGEWSVREEIRQTALAANLPLEEREDTHFFSSAQDFAKHCEGRKQLRMEYFYREMRQRQGVLMDGKKPVGGEWNYDAENRKSFGKQGPPLRLAPLKFPVDELTREVIDLVNTRFSNHPGDLESFDWPVTAEQAEAALHDFIEHRLAGFGDWQDAMWTAEPWLFHSRLSAAMNLKLLNPRLVVAAAEKAHHSGQAPLAAVEGFIRQILGWREYVRGIYWKYMPEYVDKNALNADQPLPGFYWTAETEMVCMKDAISQTLRLGYAHHIQRLMVTGLYALLLGVRPKEVHEWYLAVYVDAVEWVELPNTLGMSQHGDGGLMASKPYVASGKYIQRMSNYCSQCRFDPSLSTGANACPFTTLYWDFLLRHEVFLRKNPRMAMQMKNLSRLSVEDKIAIQEQAEKVRLNPACPS